MRAADGGRRAVPSAHPSRRAACLIALLAGCAPDVLIGHAPPRDDRDAGALPPALPEITWPSGGHPGNDYPEYVEFGVWRGRPTEVASLFPDRRSWDGLVAPSWPVNMFAPFEGMLILSVPPYPPGMGSNRDCAAGLYDARWARLGAFLVERGRGDAVLRLGWGPNDLDHDWAVARGATPDTADPADLADWITCFRNVVRAVRSTAPDIRIDWTINPLGPPWIAAYDPFVTYPGDDYVDFLGMEVFDMYPAIRDEATWDAACNAQTGLCTLASFARARGKSIGIAEWGVVGCDGRGQPDTAGNAGGDNPFFVQKVVEFFAAHAELMAYDAYFEDGGFEVCSSISNGSTNPLSAKKYRELYAIRP
jgi:hypothetical protein